MALKWQSGIDARFYFNATKYNVWNVLNGRSLVVSNLRSETKGSRFESGC